MILFFKFCRIVFLVPLKENEEAKEQLLLQQQQCPIIWLEAVGWPRRRRMVFSSCVCCDTACITMDGQLSRSLPQFEWWSTND